MKQAPKVKGEKPRAIFAAFNLAPTPPTWRQLRDLARKVIDEFGGLEACAGRLTVPQYFTLVYLEALRVDRAGGDATIFPSGLDAKKGPPEDELEWCVRKIGGKRRCDIPRVAHAAHQGPSGAVHPNGCAGYVAARKG